MVELSSKPAQRPLKRECRDLQIVGLAMAVIDLTAAFATISSMATQRVPLLLVGLAAAGVNVLGYFRVIVPWNKEIDYRKQHPNG